MSSVPQSISLLPADHLFAHPHLPGCSHTKQQQEKETFFSGEMRRMPNPGGVHRDGLFSGCSGLERLFYDPAESILQGLYHPDVTLPGLIIRSFPTSTHTTITSAQLLVWGFVLAFFFVKNAGTCCS